MAAVTALGLLGWNNLVAARPWHRRSYVPANLAATATVLAVARLRGIPASELGLSPARAPAGARYGAAVGGPIVAALAAVALSPAHRPLLRDARFTGMTGRAAIYHAAVRVPAGTVLWEETAFRAVLPALLRPVMSPVRARMTASLLFGIWHVRPTLDALRLNGIAAGRTRDGAAVLGTVAATALADLFLSGLHRATGSLLAPVMVHAAANSAGTVAAAVAGRARGRRPYDREGAGRLLHGGGQDRAPRYPLRG